MPTVARFGSLRVAIYPNDHRPAHVHVIGEGHEAVFELGEPAEGVTVRENYGFAAHDLRRIAGWLQAEVEQLREAWERVHGVQ